jgi:hypothetical protein
MESLSIPQLEERLKGVTSTLSSAEAQWAQVDTDLMQKLLFFRQVSSYERQFAISEIEALQHLWQDRAHSVSQLQEEKMMV